MYYRLDHGRSYTRQHWDKVQLDAWTTLFTALLDAAIQSCRTPEQRRFFQKTIVDRIIAFPNVDKGTVAKIAEFLQRLAREGNTDLLDTPGCLVIVESLQNQLSEPKRLSRWHKGRSQIRKRQELAKVIYPTSAWRRLWYQIRTATYGSVG